MGSLFLHNSAPHVKHDMSKLSSGSHSFWPVEFPRRVVPPNPVPVLTRYGPRIQCLMIPIVYILTIISEYRTEKHSRPRNDMYCVMPWRLLSYVHSLCQTFESRVLANGERPETLMSPKLLAGS
jgi:hypothetical protein